MDNIAIPKKNVIRKYTHIAHCVEINSDYAVSHNVGEIQSTSGDNDQIDGEITIQE